MTWWWVVGGLDGFYELRRMSSRETESPAPSSGPTGPSSGNGSNRRRRLAWVREPSLEGRRRHTSARDELPAVDQPSAERILREGLQTAKVCPGAVFRPLAARFASIPSVFRRWKLRAKFICVPSCDTFSRPRIGRHRGYFAFGVDTVSSEAPTSQAEPWGRRLPWESTWKPAKVIPASIAGKAAGVNRRSPAARSRNQDA